MYRECRHIKISGGKCNAASLKGIAQLLADRFVAQTFPATDSTAQEEDDEEDNDLDTAVDDQDEISDGDESLDDSQEDRNAKTPPDASLRGINGMTTPY